MFLAEVGSSSSVFISKLESALVDSLRKLIIEPWSVGYEDNGNDGEKSSFAGDWDDLGSKKVDCVIEAKFFLELKPGDAASSMMIESYYSKCSLTGETTLAAGFWNDRLSG